MHKDKPRSISRRRFLKVGCLSIAGLGATVCSGAGLVAALRPNPPPVELPSLSYGSATGDKVLVAYASATGSTAEIAGVVGEVLGARSFAVDVHPVHVQPPVGEYRAVAVGSAVHGGHWMPEAVDFCRVNQSALGRLPVALFSVHFFSRGDDEKSRRQRQAYLDRVRTLVPEAETVFFAGRFDQRTTAVGLPNWLAHLTPTIDLRDWDRIRAWAETVFA